MAKLVDFAEVKLSEELLGAGSGGAVRKATFQDQEIAVKIFDFLEETIKKNAEREITHLSEIDHENVIRVLGRASDGKKDYLLMEYLQDGSLHEFLYGKNKWEYTVEQAVRWALQCAKALAYLHSLKRPIVHRDIKPQNMLLHNQREDLKLCDFGLATDMSNNKSDMRGTLRYMAPEAIREVKYTAKCDVYSFGIVLWELMTRKLPYSHLENPNNQFEIMKAVTSGVKLPMDAVRSDCPEGIKQLIQCCLEINPEKRPSTKEIEKYLGELYESGTDEDFIQPLDEDTVAVVTYHVDSSGSRIMRVDFWRRQLRPIRMSFPIVKREAERLRKAVGLAAEDTGRETARAAQDGEREVRRAEKDTERETSRAAHDGERETRRAAQDVGRETVRAAKKIGKKLRF
ncbi:putative mitogen-activated protein kinase kinase kinase 7-like [Drosophila teissieri]|uniref:putative mitogen-activated protein kinase kinase kinase 7-like n=1 Tax=Drosophila teissieri TaxID=7243 RepID=UPI001CBA2021|nr:putative mitogen-activated protein kinase kinase kinase 7-like [Drosophila teissieri]